MLTFRKILLFKFSFIFVSKCFTKDYCSSEYCNNSKQHTLCKFKSSDPANHCVLYERTILNENERQMILNKMNSRRNKVAAGEIRSLPAAGSMLKLDWNKELEISAQRWADQCLKHSVPDIKDACRDLGKMSVGQNIATIHGDAPGLTPLALVDVWYMELLNINNSTTLSRYVPSSETGNSHYDYFTQLVWEETSQVGCGGVKFKERLEDVNVKYRTIYRLVCNFAPAGNLRYRSVYSSGFPCSRCPLETACDTVHKALCVHKSITKHIETEKEDNINHNKKELSDEQSTQNIYPRVMHAKSGDITSVIEIIDKTTSNIVLENEASTSFDYFSHLFDYTKSMITPHTKPHSCKEIMAVDDFVELLKKKLSNDPMIKDFISTKNKSVNSHSESWFHDVGVAAFVDRVYSKKEVPTTRKSVSSDYVNSTFLVDLIEAVIFRNGDKLPVSEGYSANTQSMSSVKPIMVQAELAQVRINDDFTGHYFFPEEDEESNTESTESYYDDINLPVSDLVLEDLKMSTVTKDFLDDIIDSDTAIESTTAQIMLSPDNINLYKTGQGVMKKFLQNIVDKHQISQINE